MPKGGSKSVIGVTDFQAGFLIELGWFGALKNTICDMDKGGNNEGL